MANPRSKQTSGEVTTPPFLGPPTIPSGVQDHSFVAQAIFDLNKAVGKLETEVSSVESRLAKVEGKIDQLTADVSSMRTTLDTVKPIVTSLGKGIWALVILVVTFGLSVAGMWLKHKMGW